MFFFKYIQFFILFFSLFSGPGARDGGGQLQPGDPGVLGPPAAREAVRVHADQEGQRGVTSHAAPRHPDQQRRVLPEHVPREVHQGFQRREGDDEGRQQEGDGESGQRSSGEGALGFKPRWSSLCPSLSTSCLSSAPAAPHRDGGGETPGCE